MPKANALVATTLTPMTAAAVSLSRTATSARPARLFGFWKGTMESPEGKKRAYVDDAALLDLFEQLEGATEPGRVSFRYLLTLMLMRKRLLKHEGTRREARGQHNVMQVRQVTPAGATPAPVVEVIDPGMNDSAVAEAIEQLTAVMADGAGTRQ